MSIAEKLTTVAENQQKVYAAGTNAGYNGGYGDGYGIGYEEGYNDGTDDGYAMGNSDGIEQGKKEAIENLPAGYLKVDPAWTSFAYLCQSRPSIVASIKYSDTANGTNFTSMFQSCNVTSIPSLDLRKGTNFNGMFAYSYYIEEIGEIDISSATGVANMFLSTKNLKRITFVPGCIKLSIAFAQSNSLEDTAIQSILDGLADLTGQTTQTLTFHADVGAKLTDEQKASITAKNWTLAY